MRVKLERRDDWKKMKEQYNTIELIKALRDITYKFEGHTNAYLSLHMTQCNVFLMKQGKEESVTAYRERHNTVTRVVEGLGGASLWGSTAMVDIELKKINPSLSLGTVNQNNTGEKLALSTAMECSKEKALAMHFLLGAYRAHLQTLLVGLENDFNLGQDNYPSN